MSGPCNYRMERRRSAAKSELVPLTHAAADNAFKAWQQREASKPSKVKFIPKRR